MREEHVELTSKSSSTRCLFLPSPNTQQLSNSISLFFKMDEIFRNLSLQKANKIPLSIPSFVQTALPKLPLHLPTIVRSALLFWAIQTLSKVVSPKLSRTYRTLGSKVANRWDAKVVCKFATKQKEGRGRAQQIADLPSLLPSSPLPRSLDRSSRMVGTLRACSRCRRGLWVLVQGFSSCGYRRRFVLLSSSLLPSSSPSPPFELVGLELLGQLELT